MSEDPDQTGDAIFLQSMENLSAKQGGARASGGRRPIESVEALDFDALMRGGRGPATLVEASGAREAVEERPEGAGLGRVEPAPTEASAGRRPGRYRVSAEESGAFLAALGEAMGGDNEPEAASQRAPVRQRRARASLKEQLRRGAAIDAELDLHGRTTREARPRVEAFLREAQREGWELVRIIVGKGLNSPDGEAVLRPAVETWLADDFRELVAEFTEAGRGRGGSGALIIAVRLQEA